MRLRNFAFGLSIPAFLLVSFAAAQQPAATQQSGNVNVQVNVGPNAPLAFGEGQEYLFDIKVMLGLPTAVRLQVPFEHGPDFSYALEGTVGFFPGYFSDSVFYALGARASYTLGNNFLGGRLLVNPGIDLAYFDNHESTLAATASLEMLWLSEFNSHFALEIGIDAGIGVGIASFNDRDRAGDVFPVISAFAGLRF